MADKNAQTPSAGEKPADENIDEMKKKEAELAAKEAELAEKEAALKKAEQSLNALAEKLETEHSAESGTVQISGGSGDSRWIVKNDCFAKGVLYHEGDIIKGGDFSKNPNIEKLN